MTCRKKIRDIQNASSRGWLPSEIVIFLGKVVWYWQRCKVPTFYYPLRTLTYDVIDQWPDLTGKRSGFIRYGSNGPVSGRPGFSSLSQTAVRGNCDKTSGVALAPRALGRRWLIQHSKQKSTHVKLFLRLPYITGEQNNSSDVIYDCIGSYVFSFVSL